MANMVIPDEGKPILLDIVTQKVSNAALGWLLGVYTNSGYTPSNASVFADLTIAAWGGWSPITLVGSTWQSATVIANQGSATYDSSSPNWTVGSSPPTVYGWCIYTPSSPKLLFIQALTTPIVTATGGILAIPLVLKDTYIP